MKGELTEVGLVDLIQITCHDRTPSHLAVRHRDREGSLYFEGGEIVHAETGSLQGREALSAILKWSDGSFELAKRVPAPTRTLTGSATILLLAAMEQIDKENSGQAGDGTRGIDLSEEKLAREMSEFEENMRRELEAGAATAHATTSGDAVNEETAEQDVVRRLRRIPGVEGALQIARDGTVLAHDYDGDPEPAAAVTVFVGNAATELGEALAVGFFERGSVVVGGDRTLVVEQRDGFVGLLLEERASPDLVYSEARRLLG